MLEPRVFISYARKDGEKYATKLRQRLLQKNIPLWQDRIGEEGGRDWWLQCVEALWVFPNLVDIQLSSSRKLPLSFKLNRTYISNGRMFSISIVPTFNIFKYILPSFGLVLIIFSKYQLAF